MRMSRFRSDRRGLAALEFALTAPLLFMILGGVIDFGLIMVGRSRLANGLAQGLQYALSTGAGVKAADISAAVRGGSSRAGLTEVVAVSVTGPACYCVTGSPATLGTRSALSASNTCTSTCPVPANGPGVFVTITATYTYQPLLPLFSNLTSPTVTQTTTARLL
jgi:Flp pilus assembly protein TadG